MICFTRIFFLFVVLVQFNQVVFCSSRRQTPLAEGLGSAFAKLTCAPSKQRLETNDIFKAGDFVRIVHGVNFTAKGEVMGTFADRMGATTPKDLLEVIRQKPSYIAEVAVLVPNKDKTWLHSVCNSVVESQMMIQQISRHAEILDPYKFYEVKLKLKNESQIVGTFPYTHVSCLKRIDQAQFNQEGNRWQPDFDLDDLFAGNDIDGNCS